MEYKRSYALDILGIIVVVVLTILSIILIQYPIGCGNTPEERIENLRQSIRERRLDESPITVEEAERKWRPIIGSENETSEERRAHLQRSVDFYNNQLESDQASVREEIEEKEKMKEQLMNYIFIGSGVFILFLLVRVIAMVCQPPALAISGDALRVKSTLFSRLKVIDLADIHKIQYKIQTSWWSRRRAYVERRLYFMDASGYTIENIDLAKLSRADFNTIQSIISDKAPHIEWIYPY